LQGATIASRNGSERFCAIYAVLLRIRGSRVSSPLLCCAGGRVRGGAHAVFLYGGTLGFYLAASEPLLAVDWSHLGAGSLCCSPSSSGAILHFEQLSPFNGVRSRLARRLVWSSLLCSATFESVHLSPSSSKQVKQASVVKCKFFPTCTRLLHPFILLLSVERLSCVFIFFFTSNVQPQRCRCRCRFG